MSDSTSGTFRGLHRWLGFQTESQKRREKIGKRDRKEKREKRGKKIKKEEKKDTVRSFQERKKKPFPLCRNASGV